MRYNELISILKESMEIEPKAEKESGSIMEIKLLNKELQHWNEHTLYLGSMDNTQAQPCKPIMLISPDKNLNLPEGSLYSLVRHEDLFKVYNMAEELILEDLRADGLFVELAQMALSGIKISSLINNAATLMGNALILTDSAQKVLAHSTNFEIMDPSWAANIERGYCSNEFIQKVRANKYMKEWSKQGSDIQLITLPGDLQPKLVARFTQEGHIAG